VFGELLRSLSERFGEDPLDYDSDDEPRAPLAQRPLVGATLRARPPAPLHARCMRAARALRVLCCACVLRLAAQP
jgi:hypothetical protein